MRKVIEQPKPRPPLTQALTQRPNSSQRDESVGGEPQDPSRSPSCPSWARTRTLLIQSQACCQLHQGAGTGNSSLEPTVRQRMASYATLGV